MRKPILIAAVATLAVVAAACGTPSVTVQNTGADQNATGIAVSGTGEVTGVPDTLTVSIGVSVLRPSVDRAVADAAEKADALISALKSAGVAEKDIQTANYSIFPEYDYRGEGQELRGYRVNNTVVAKIRDVDAAGSVIDAATSVGGDDVIVQGVSFSIDDDSALVEAARAKAFDDARKKAEQLASLAGVSLGAPISITESFSSVPPIPYFGRAEALGADQAVTPIEPGQQAVTVTVSVRFAIGG